MNAQAFGYARSSDCKSVVGLNTKHSKSMIGANDPISGHAQM